MAVSASFHAFGLIEMKASPGGTMKAFCEPPITTSRPQPSISRGMVPKPGDGVHYEDRVRLRDRCGHRFHVVRRAGRSFRRLHENALCRGFAVSAASTCAAVTACPVGHVITLASRP